RETEPQKTQAAGVSADEVQDEADWLVSSPDDHLRDGEARSVDDALEEGNIRSIAMEQQVDFNPESQKTSQRRVLENAPEHISPERDPVEAGGRTEILKQTINIDVKKAMPKAPSRYAQLQQRASRSPAASPLANSPRRSPSGAVRLENSPRSSSRSQRSPRGPFWVAKKAETTRETEPQKTQAAGVSADEVQDEADWLVSSPDDHLRDGEARSVDDALEEGNIRSIAMEQQVDFNPESQKTSQRR
ncbi:unnamed protein product, partial [Durusdinium trenchii]